MILVAQTELPSKNDISPMTRWQIVARFVVLKKCITLEVDMYQSYCQIASSFTDTPPTCYLTLTCSTPAQVSSCEGHSGRRVNIDMSYDHRSVLVDQCTNGIRISPAG